MDEICRFCKKGDTDDVYFSYWRAIKFPCHTACKAKGVAEEAYECQLIDADCNDCKNFRRGRQTKTKGCWYGWCDKKDIDVVALVNFASSYDCFEHRKD